MTKALRLVSLATAIAWLMTLPASAGELKVGDAAPDFTLQASDGKTYTLADFRGRQAIVLAWFPKANTPGCTTVDCVTSRLRVRTKATGEEVERTLRLTMKQCAFGVLFGKAGVEPELAVIADR